jgi:methionyl aminopeptidase
MTTESFATPDRPGRNDPCWCGSGQKYKRCHLRSDQAAAAPHPAPRRGPVIKTTEQVEGIRRACQLSVAILDSLADRVVPGITTADIDRWVVEATAAAGARAATLGYKGFPRSCCTSINEVVCHGIPGDRVLREGDILNVDVTSVLDGYYGDTSRMYLVGEVAPEARRLVEVTRQCLDLGVAQVRPLATLGDVGAAIQRHAESHGFSVVREFGGHGVGLAFHEEPHVPHTGRPGTGLPLAPGMVFTIEPMINAGGLQVELLRDGWTAVTKDRSLSAQFEHTVAVTERGVDVLTA